jgi:hypothetical protein
MSVIEFAPDNLELTQYISFAMVKNATNMLVMNFFALSLSILYDGN